MTPLKLSLDVEQPYRHTAIATLTVEANGHKATSSFAVNPDYKGGAMQAAVETVAEVLGRLIEVNR